MVAGTQGFYKPNAQRERERPYGQQLLGWENKTITTINDLDSIGIGDDPHSQYN